MDPYRYFSDRRPGEEVIMLLRRHWSIIVRHFLLLIAEFFLPLIIVFVFLNFTDFVFEQENPLTIIIILVASAYYLYIWLFFFHHWIDYYLDVWVVTNQRILNIEQEGLFSRTIAELNMERVQDVTSEVKGKVATVLDFGDVHIQTAGEEKRFIFEEISKPREVASRIMALHQEAVKKTATEQRLEASEKILNKQENSPVKDQNETKSF